MNIFLCITIAIWCLCCVITIIIYGVVTLKWYIHTLKDYSFTKDCKDIKKAIDKNISNFKKESSVSILICARNEGENLQKFLEKILAQKVPPLTTVELLVVNDDSTDNTKDILEELVLLHQKKCAISFFKKKKKQPLCVKSFKKMTFISEFVKKSKKNYINNLNISISFRNLHIHSKKQIGKKFALSEGIQAAKGEWILVTDADCYPNSPYWLWSMLEKRNYNIDNTDFVLGYSPYAKNKSSLFLNKWIRFEALLTLCQYASAAHWQLPYMGVGRNMLYRKRVFTENYNWRKNADLVSGDDDLFVNAVATGQNTILCLNPLSWVYSVASNTWKAYFKQKKRHFTTGTRYKLRHQLFLGLWTQSHIWFWLLLPSIFFIYNVDLFYYLLALCLIRTAIFAIVISYLCHTFRTKELIMYIPLLDVLLTVYYIIFAPILMLNINLKTWN